MHRLQYSAYGKEYVQNNVALLQRFDERDGPVQYFGDHLDDLPPLARMQTPVNADIRRTFKAVQETEGYVDHAVDAVKRSQSVPGYRVRELEKRPHVHRDVVDYGKGGSAVRTRHTELRTESYIPTRRKY